MTFKGQLESTVVSVQVMEKEFGRSVGNLGFISGL